MALYSIYKVELLGFLHQGKNRDSGFYVNMILRNIFEPTSFESGVMEKNT